MRPGVLTILSALALGALLTAGALAAPAAPTAAERPAALKEIPAFTADHRQFKVLQKEFRSGPEVTEACLSCHTEAAKQVQHTKHWTWQSVDPKTGQVRGKRNIINNYCTSPVSNEKDCMACHAGYGWKDKSFDFTVEKNVDCLVCHDTTGTYRKLPGFAGHPVYTRTEFPKDSGKFVEAVDLKQVARSVGLPSRSNCGSCHFFGAGGNGTKHGDLSTSLQHPGKYLDVHMDEKGLDFACVTCHVTSSHQVAGSRYNVAAALKGGAHIRGKRDESPASCQSCHGNKPHPQAMARLNQHTDKLACQTCHIPAYARDGIGTELSWDWSHATEMGPDGKPVVLKDSAGRRAFDSKKGVFVWDSYLIPEYRWFNGTSTYKVIGDKIDPTKTVHINEIGGSPADPDSRIWPMKVHRGKQPYDKVNLTLTLQHTGGEDDTALWHNYDWQKAIKAGMKAGGLPYSGEFGFVETAQTWPITHMVAPKGDALGCADCHSRQGRLAGVEGVYLPGRDGSKALDMLGWTLALLTMIAVMVHGGVRVYASRRKGK